MQKGPLSSQGSGYNRHMVTLDGSEGDSRLETAELECLVTSLTTLDQIAEYSYAKSLRGSHVSSVSDPEKLAAYAKLALPAVIPFGARFLARGNAVIAREQGVKGRTVVVEYPSLENATAAYDSAGYAEALKALGDGAVRDFRLVEGVE